MELEIKDLTPYLPYKVSVSNYDFTEVVEVTLFNIHDALIAINNGHFRLVLRNLSDLTKEIEHKGEGFVPIDELDKYHDFSILNYKDIMSTPVRYPYTVVQKLLEWHFDIFNLIQNDLAIDINTIKQ